MNHAILIATDGSPCATRAVDHGLDLAKQLDAKVHALYVVDTNRGPESGWDIVVERQEAEGEKALEETAAKAKGIGRAITPHLRRGKPSEEILAGAQEYETDYVVMGTCGHSGLKRLLRPGSTAQRVIRQCTCPVVVVPPECSNGE